jgi:hypothetical protein
MHTLIHVDDVARLGGQLYSRRDLVQMAKAATRDKTCPDGHRIEASHQHLAIGQFSFLVQHNATYVTFATWCRNGGCDYASDQLAVRIPA